MYTSCIHNVQKNITNKLTNYTYHNKTISYSVEYPKDEFHTENRTANINTFPSAPYSLCKATSKSFRLTFQGNYEK